MGVFPGRDDLLMFKDPVIAGPVYLLFDYFNELVDTDLVLGPHVPNFSSIGAAYVAREGAEVWLVQQVPDNLRLTTAVLNNSSKGINLGEIIVDVRFDMFLAAAGVWHTGVGVAGDAAGAVDGIEIAFWDTNTLAMYRNGVQQGAAEAWPAHDDAWHAMRLLVEADGTVSFFRDGVLRIQRAVVLAGLTETHLYFNRGQDAVNLYRVDNLIVVRSGTGW